MEEIKDGEFVVIQRDNYMRTQKLVASKNCHISLGKDQIELANVIGQPYGSAFKMVPHATKKKLWIVEKTDEILNFEEMFLGDKSGTDNRNILGIYERQIRPEMGL